MNTLHLRLPLQKQDYEHTEKWINGIVSDFASATDNVAFINANSDVDFDDSWYKKEDLPEDIGTWAFETDAEVNSIFGPYFEDDAYKLAKLYASEMMPDSVEARHILLRINTQPEVLAKQALADSLKSAIESGSDFASLASAFSDDQGSAIQGGDLGWFGRGQMVKPFEVAAFNNKVNEITIVSVSVWNTPCSNHRPGKNIKAGANCLSCAQRNTEYTNLPECVRKSK